MKILLTLLLLISLSGCASNPPRTQIINEVVTVEKAVYTIPEFEIPSKPVLPTDTLSEEDRGDHNSIGKAYVTTIVILKGYANQLYEILQGIKKDPVK